MRARRVGDRVERKAWYAKYFTVESIRHKLYTIFRFRTAILEEMVVRIVVGALSGSAVGVAGANAPGSAGLRIGASASRPSATATSACALRGQRVDFISFLLFSSAAARMAGRFPKP